LKNDKKMYTISLSGNTYTVEVISKNQLKINGEVVDFEVRKEKNKVYVITYNDHSYFVLIKRYDALLKEMEIQVEQQIFQLKVRDDIDDLLDKLGIDYSDMFKVSELKAPMPGLVLDILVEAGQEVKKGDNLLVISAMKMENNIKSPVDAVVKEVKVDKNIAVNKNQVLVEFE